jgi:cutinase
VVKDFQYPANASPDSKSNGVTDVLRRLNGQSKNCPEQRFAIVGYSQGASVMHAAAPKMEEAIQKKILAAVMFGDPGLGPQNTKFPPILQERLYENCAPADPVSRRIRLY